MNAAGRATAAATKATAAAKAQALRGTGEAEKLLKTAKAELANENVEIGNYLSIETLANALGDRDTEKLAREFRRQEERMAAFLSKLIPQLTRAVVTEEVPASERRAATSGRTRRAKRSAKARPAKRTAKARPAKRSAKARPAKRTSKARPAKRTAKARPAKRAKPAKRAATT